jgi:GTPase SAR1 family protein
MAFVNLKNKEIQVKIVYYGPGRGGKTTNLEYIYKKFRQRINTEMVTVKTHGDRTLLLVSSMGMMLKFSSTRYRAKLNITPREGWSSEV